MEKEEDMWPSFIDAVMCLIVALVVWLFLKPDPWLCGFTIDEHSNSEQKLN